MLTVESAAPGEGISDLMLSIDSGDISSTLDRLGIPGTWDVASGDIWRLVGGWLTAGDILMVVYPGDIWVCGACFKTGEGIVWDWIAAFNLCLVMKMHAIKTFWYCMVCYLLVIWNNCKRTLLFLWLIISYNFRNLKNYVILLFLIHFANRRIHFTVCKDLSVSILLKLNIKQVKSPTEADLFGNVGLGLNRGCSLSW